MSWSWSLTFQVAFDVNPGDTPATGDWTDLTGRVKQVSIRTGTPQGGSCTLLLDNRDRQLDPTNPSATLNLIPMRHARLTATYDGTTYPLWRGFVEEWPPVWPTVNQGMVNVKLVDATVWLALQDTDLELPRQRTHERIIALLDLANWPESMRDIGDGVVRLDGYEQPSANLLRALVDTHESEDGDLYVSPDGLVTFRSRHHRFDRAPVAVLGGLGVKVGSVTPDYSATNIVNVSRAEMADGRVFEERDEVSVDQSGERGLAVRDLTLPWYEADGKVKWVLARYSRPRFEDGSPVMWLDNLTVDARPAGVLAEILPRRVGDLVAFTHTPPGDGQAEYQGHIESITHQIGQGTWTTSWDLSPYFGEGPWMVWHDDEATEGDGWVDDETTVGAKWAP